MNVYVLAEQNEARLSDLFVQDKESLELQLLSVVDRLQHSIVVETDAVAYRRGFRVAQELYGRAGMNSPQGQYNLEDMGNGISYDRDNKQKDVDDVIRDEDESVPVSSSPTRPRR